jgi:hypothetical protein
MSAPKLYFAIIHRAKSESDLLRLDKLVAELKGKSFAYSGKMPEALSNFIIQGGIN